MEHILSRYAALYIWEPIINNTLSAENLYLGNVICVRKIRKLEYMGYFEVKPLSKTSKKRFGQLYIHFDKRGGIITNTLILWNNSGKVIINSLKDEELILDNRSEFDLAYSSDTSSGSE
jgi:hypothetical protein